MQISLFDFQLNHTDSTVLTKSCKELVISLYISGEKPAEQKKRGFLTKTNRVSDMIQKIPFATTRKSISWDELAPAYLCRESSVLEADR